MISVCCCSINSKFDTKSFIEALAFHNQNLDFEIVLVHDNRVEDGSKEFFAELAKQYKQLRVIEQTKEDVVDWFTQLISWYKRNRIFPKELQEVLVRNLAAYIDGTLLKTNEEILWVPSGRMYNTAIAAARGDILIVSPADYIINFKLRVLEAAVEEYQRDGILYWKPHSYLLSIDNRPLAQIRETGARTRDYLLQPTFLDSLYIGKHSDNNMFCVGSKTYCEEIREFTRDPTIGRLRFTHGLHVMTRKAYDEIGGFTEDFYGRAWSDDKMSQMGWKVCPWGQASQPSWLSYIVTQNSVLYGIPLDEELDKVDPWHRLHPLSPYRQKLVYLSQGSSWKPLDAEHNWLPGCLRQRGNRSTSGAFTKPKRF
jgi:hypothetical protein